MFLPVPQSLITSMSSVSWSWDPSLDNSTYTSPPVPSPRPQRPIVTVADI